MKHNIMQKRGVGDVVATVLIVVIIVLAVGLVGFFVFNFINDKSVDLSDLNLNIKSAEAFYNNQQMVSNILNANESKETVYVSVERGSDEANLTGLKFVFTIKGNSQSCLRTTVPGLLETSVYAFKSSIFSVKPEKVEVVPIVTIGKTEKIAKTGFNVRISETQKVFTERVDECGGFCCGVNDDLPSNPSSP